MRTLYVLFLLLLLASRRGEAQTSPAVAASPLAMRWALGGQLAFYPRVAFAETPTGPDGRAFVRPWPVMLVLSYRSAPRAAVEAGLLVRAAPAHTTTEITSAGTYVVTTRATTWAVPVLVRAQVAPRLPKRWQLDGEFGLMILSSKYSEEATYTDARTGQNALFSSDRQSYSDFPLLVGVGGKYELTPYLSLTADARLTWSFLGTFLVQALTKRNDFVAPITPAISAGVSYQFGAAKP